VKNDAKCMPAAGTHRTYAMAHGNPKGSVRVAFRPILRGENDGIAAPHWDDINAWRQPRTLLAQNKFATSKVTQRLGQQDHHLQRKPLFAANVLHKTMVIVGTKALQKRRWSHLAGLMATLDKFTMPGWIANVTFERSIPDISQRH
jgi:hypothetical protein